MIQISTDTFALILLCHAIVAWVAFVLHLRQLARMREQLGSLPLGRGPEITEPSVPAFDRRAAALPWTRAFVPTRPLPGRPEREAGC